MTASEAYPLKWPQARPRTPFHQRFRGQFSTSMARARDGLLNELRRMNAQHVVISSNLETYVRGGQTIPYANQNRLMEDPGVAIYYTWKGEQYCLSCDKYKDISDNMQAINKTIEAIRGIERWGTGDMMRAAFQGFKELPPPPPTPEFDPYKILGLGLGASQDDIKASYRSLVKKFHPDMPDGDRKKFDEIQKAYNQLTDF